MKAFERTDLTCPDCRGPIQGTRQDRIKEYRCRVGHRYSPETYLATQRETQERTLWAAVIALEEGAEVLREIAADLEPAVKRRYEQEAKNKVEAAGTIREVIALVTKDQAQQTQETTLDPVGGKADDPTA